MPWKGRQTADPGPQTRAAEGSRASDGVALRGTVSGRVQAVGFRWSTAREASRLGIVGWVRNLADGRVEIFIQGGAAPIGEMQAFLSAGPPSARVVSVDLKPAAVDPELTRFDIR